MCRRERHDIVTKLRLDKTRAAGQDTQLRFTEQRNIYEGDGDDDNDEEYQYDHVRTDPALTFSRPKFTPKMSGCPQTQPQTHMPTGQRVGRDGDKGQRAGDDDEQHNVYRHERMNELGDEGDDDDQDIFDRGCRNDGYAPPKAFACHVRLQIARRSPYTGAPPCT
jgi:hypothetical protein